MHKPYFEKKKKSFDYTPAHSSCCILLLSSQVGRTWPVGDHVMYTTSSCDSLHCELVNYLQVDCKSTKHRIQFQRNTSDQYRAISQSHSKFNIVKSKPLKIVFGEQFYSYVSIYLEDITLRKRTV